MFKLVVNATKADIIASYTDENEKGISYLNNFHVGLHSSKTYGLH